MEIFNLSCLEMLEIFPLLNFLSRLSIKLMKKALVCCVLKVPE